MLLKGRRDAGVGHRRHTLTDAVVCQYRKAADGGYGGEDMAAIFRAFRL